MFSNFGLTFRSSKWSLYDKNNIKNKSKILFSNYIFICFFMFISILLIFFFNSYYVKFFFFNNFFFLMWAIVDSFDYYLSFLLWSTTTLSSLTFNFVYSYFFFNNFSKKTKISDLFIKRVKIKNDYDVFSDKRLSSSKFDLNWILYSWLSNNKVKNKHFLIENLFEAHVNKSWWEKNFNFFITLYKTFFFLNYINEGSDAYSVKQGINGVSSFFIKKNTNNLLLFISNNFLINKYTDVLLFHSLNKYSNFFSQKNNFLMHKNFKNWNLNFFLKNEDKYVFLLKSKIGFFFF